MRVLCLSLLLPLAVIAGLVGPTPASATDHDSGPPAGESAPASRRAWVVAAWKSGGPGTKAAAEAALTGGDEDVQRFLDTVWPKEEYEDDRVAASQKTTIGGPALQKAAREALNSNDPYKLRAFLEYDWKTPLEEDQRVFVAQVINEGGPGVREAGRAALDGSAADIRKFLERGQYVEREKDGRVEVAQVINEGGSQVRAAGRTALNGTAQDIREFLEVGQFVARAQDQEQTTVAQLAEMARNAGRRAAAETAAAKRASAQAVTASDNAKREAQRAAKAASKAHKNTQEAADAARGAANAAKGAAVAARRAVDAARAANRSARVAANAAAQAASAAAGASQASSRARQAAAAAAGDARNAAAARKAAEDARAAAKGADKAADAADEATKAATQAGVAAKSAASAGANALMAAESAERASSYAGQADAHAAAARRAAAQSRRQAEEANRAAGTAESLARQAAAKAREARDAARKAAQHARESADAAEKAAKYAGQAGKAAERSAVHAKAAREAANEASSAVAKAKATYKLARKIEDAELLTRTHKGIEQAKELKSKADELQSEQDADVRQEEQFEAQARRLTTEAAKPGVDVKDVATKGRKAALLAMKVRGPWGRAAAAAALGGSDQDVAEYIRNGWKLAAAQDERVQAERLASESSLAAVRQAAEKALKGGPTQISEFLTTGQYQAGASDFRVHIAQIINEGGPGVQQAGRAALNSNSPDQYRKFILTGQYTARYQDERVRAAQLANSGGPELKAAARIAMESPPYVLHAFIGHGQYMAKRKDLLAATHKARVQQLIAESARTAATAQQNAFEAEKAAALAAHKAAEAKSYARQAKESAASAKKSADQARGFAKNAKASAARAAESAKTARKAAADANRAAENAALSVNDASVSAELAHVSASIAWTSAKKARASALAAGKDAKAANKAAKDALKIAVEKAMAEAKAQRKAEADAKEKAHQEAGRRASELYRCGMLGCDARVSSPNFPTWCTKNRLMCDILADADNIEEAMRGIWNVEKKILGLESLEACAKDKDILTCGDLFKDVLISSKLKALRTAYETLNHLSKGWCIQCFPAGTKVLMGDGSTRNIEDIKPGDQVLSTDPISGETGSQEATHKIVTEHDKRFNELTIATHRGPEKLTATYEHPFWSPSEHRWVPASDLKPGTSLRSNDGSTVRVEANHAFEKHARTYNLTVNGLHTYYVLAGETPVLVHNSGGHTPENGMVTVGRWMSPAEHQAMMETGMVQRGGGGFTYVVYPASRDAYISARPGSVYVEFDVPKSSLIPGGRPGDFKMSDSDTIFARLAKKKGNPVPELPKAKNVKLGGWGCL
ncbi:hypothetical protein K9S39_39135 [Streptomyces halobius]|uniref:Hint domain-containing protein n=1 Tax=Streptomyces halobius TaxID=2879846 RepID=A0ABY4MH83_9ACTN|nr:hypothetical protein K9S39_39135 [Streptomyces halobius]